ncbi:glycosyltransferase family 31 protein [Polychaeton citri CBS 116435]|uniref:Glycosyltransferase family 31 protein n=1 Tax=Polychaeton citri CBS 116435 TaxID=1314669 RepID=A0A9P4Q8N7_9PEZI|nr:glycosyltransferase family 31 protein [Polychaeton citri CBS 116435]
MYAPRKRARIPAFITLLVIPTLYILWAPSANLRAGWPDVDLPFTTRHHLLCKDLPGANETLVVLKTGATELDAKLPVHFNTTMQCYPNMLIFSDSAEIIENHTVIDALESVSPDLKDTHPDFEIYRRLRDHGRQIQLSDKLHNEDKPESWTGNAENPGWKLDKWKFLPMVSRTFYEYPLMKWYVFIEADSYIIWPTLLEHLATLDHTIPYYAGVTVYIDGIGFAHGGSGFIVSQPAMHLVASYIDSNQEKLENFTGGHWAGDCVLGKTFTDAGVPLTDAWPIIQGDHPGMVPYIADDGRPMPPSDKRIWCNPTISYHHVPPAMVEDFWNFEQEWLSRAEEGQSVSMRHSDVFQNYIIPRIQSPRLGWDNESGDEAGIAADFDTCRSWCEANKDCVQYSYDSESRCWQFHLPRLGKYAPGKQSGWLVDRIEQLAANLAPCDARD